MMEEWKNTNNTCPQMKTIIAVSNYGRLKLRKTQWNKGLTGTEYVSHYPNGVRNSNRAKEG